MQLVFFILVKWDLLLSVSEFAQLISPLLLFKTIHKLYAIGRHKNKGIVFSCNQLGMTPVMDPYDFRFSVNLYSWRWVTCGNGPALCSRDIIVLATGTHTEERPFDVHTLGFSTHTAQQLTLIYIYGEKTEKQVDKCYHLETSGFFFRKYPVHKPLNKRGIKKFYLRVCKED